MGQNEAVHADHHGQGEFLGDAEGLDVQVHGFLIGFGEELQPAAVALAHRVGVVVPDVDGRADGAVGDRHDDRQTETARVVDGLHHEEKALARRGRVGASARDGGADRHRHRREFAFDVDVFAVLQNALAAEKAQVFDDVGLRRNRIGADDVRTTQCHGLRDALAALKLFKHALLPIDG